MRPSSAPTCARVGQWLAAGLVSLLLHATITPAEAQLTVAPGPLSKAHAAVEGVTKCQKCHESGSGISAERCLECHKPIAERIAARKGVHKDVAGNCTKCHVEHRGEAADLRRFDTASFKHATTGFALEGRHAQVASKCAACHKTRSFLKAEPRCASCHADVHRPTLGDACGTCHPVTTAFRDAKTRFDHAKAAFALDGAHRSVDCAKCHANKVYRRLRFGLCSDCHRGPHNPPLPGACTTCHTTEAWKTQKVEHARTGFVLKGRHQTAKCTSCHVQPPVKVKLSGDRCATCHGDVHRGEFRQDCGACHTEQGWSGAAFDHPARTRSAFALTGKHANLVCTACHKEARLTRAAAPGAPPALRHVGKDGGGDAVDFRGLGTSCASCHKDPHGAELGARCDSCHTTTTFRVTAFTHSSDARFFAGQHSTVACVRCHVPNAAAAPADAPRPTGAAWAFKKLSRACASCHPDPHLGQVDARCETCHSIDAKAFAPLGFSHDRASFALTGKHQGVACEKCHKKETGTYPSGSGTSVRLKGVSTACRSCHADRHLGQVGPKCEGCHTSASFKVSSYKHAPKPGFFVAKHATARCEQCHKEQEGTFPAGRGKTIRYVGSGTSCASCHADQHRGALGTACATCHEPSAWGVVSRAFHKAGGFALEGRHLTVECGSCHAGGVTKGTPTRCYDCHWVRRQDDRYRTQLGSDCERCHRPTTWTAVKWSHEANTGVRLSPVHQALGCESCHARQDFSSPGTSCSSCHAQDYQRTASPNHAAAGFPANCDLCHRPYQSSWQQAVFNHSSQYALVGVHASQPCATCHRNNVYHGTATTCYGCHKADYDHTQNPNHASSGFSTTCDSCHRATDPAFRGAAFRHDTTFQLVGVHATQACSACHKNGTYKGTPRECYPCHQVDYQRAQNPNHVTAGMPTTCDSCHRPTDPSFASGGTFNHASTFALVGVHATQPCSACHKNGVYKGTPRDCFGCHQANYQAAQNPNHVAGGFATTCDLCHRPTDPTFQTAGAFNHATYFALAGVHAAQACGACHKNNVYKGTPRLCSGCHLADYQRAQNPNHVGAGFPTTCDNCHKFTDATWQQAVFNHTYFPITSGRHITACANCHTDPTNYSLFNCLTCHDRGTTDAKHVGRAGYRYDSVACYSCHPRG